MAREPWRWPRLLQWALVLIGIACLAQYGWLSRRTTGIENANRTAVERILGGPDAKRPEPSSVSPESPGDSGFLGEIVIPRLGVSAAVRYGDDEEALDGSVGYLSDTALPGTEGNTVLAGHRDRLFRALQHIRKDDEILIATRQDTFAYRVNRTFVVGPGDVWILQPVANVDLTLITCYPFTFIGHAPQRFVVRARKVSGVVRPGPDVEREHHEDDP